MLDDDSDSILSEMLDSDEDSEEKDSEAEDANEPKRKKFHGVVTKAYREPQRNIAVTVVKKIPKPKPLGVCKA